MRVTCTEDEFWRAAETAIAEMDMSGRSLPLTRSFIRAQVQRSSIPSPAAESDRDAQTRRYRTYRRALARN